MNGFDLLNLLGALAIFLYGMKVMSDALMNLAGERLRQIMVRLTSNRFKGMLTGLGITSLLQSSSATTLMVVSFVSAGLLSLTEAISVIMGANIGTTLTAWLITLIGFKIQLTAIALPATMIGFVLSSQKKPRTRNIGLFIVGFCLLFIGLEMMKDTVPDLKNDPVIMHLMQAPASLGILGAIKFVLIGSVLTVILQSSSATMAITLVAASQGVIGYEAAAAMVLGENIGTTITANVAALVGGVHAKRAAFAHFLFNLFGVTWVLLLFSYVNQLVWMIAESFFGTNAPHTSSDIPVALSIFHSLFNITNTFLLIGFVKAIASLCRHVIKAKPDEAAAEAGPLYLDEQFLDYPETGIQALYQETRQLYRFQLPAGIALSADIDKAEIFRAEDLPTHQHRNISDEISVENYKKTFVKPLYLKALEFGTRLQSKLSLNESQLDTISALKQLNRNVQLILRTAIAFEIEFKSEENRNNETVKTELCRFREEIIHLLRFYESIWSIRAIPECDAELRAKREYVKKLDTQLIKRVEEHLVNETVSAPQASSLMVCSMGLVTLNQLMYKSYRQINKLKLQVADTDSFELLTD
ncbi:Uncharacterised protein [BD1-7 clade bacterium]|uniref:PhoU domain-containing protein n=1 Tax=BD1-7 clade bacterium TaxID=2029982 RepID=A0A5S9R088_9GAMM|nr:Uncharacterised protein [BD1-7 clade bacterium]